MARRLKTSTKHTRGSNSKTIEFSKKKKNPEAIEETLEDFQWSKFDYLRRRNKPDGKHYKPPQAVAVTFTVKQGRKEFYYTKLTDIDFVVTRKSLPKFVQDKYKELTDDWNSRREAMENLDDGDEPDDGDTSDDYKDNLDPAKVTEVTVKFIY